MSKWVSTVRRACHALFLYELKGYRYVLFCWCHDPPRTPQTLSAGQNPDIRTDVRTGYPAHELGHQTGHSNRVKVCSWYKTHSKTGNLAGVQLPPQPKAFASTTQGICLQNSRTPRHLPTHLQAFAPTTKLTSLQQSLHRLQRNLKKRKHGSTHRCPCSSPWKPSGMISARQPLLLSRQSCHSRLF